MASRMFNTQAEFLDDVSLLTMAAEDGLQLAKQASTTVNSLVGAGSGALIGALLNSQLNKHKDDKEGRKRNQWTDAAVGAALGALPGAAAGYLMSETNPTISTSDGTRITQAQYDAMQAQRNDWDKAYEFSHAFGGAFNPRGHGLSGYALNAIPATVIGASVTSPILRSPWVHPYMERIGFNPDRPSTFFSALTGGKSLINHLSDTIARTVSNASKGKTSVDTPNTAQEEFFKAYAQATKTKDINNKFLKDPTFKAEEKVPKGRLYSHATQEEALAAHAKGNTPVGKVDAYSRARHLGTIKNLAISGGSGYVLYQAARSLLNGLADSQRGLVKTVD